MNNAPIAYTPTENDRTFISATFGCDLDAVPTKLTGGRLNDDATGVLFGETVHGYRIDLPLAGRPVLTAIARTRFPRAAA